MVVLRGERVLIRPMTAAHVPRLAAIQAQPGVAAAWRQPDAEKLEGKAANTAAIRAYEKAGFKPVGVMRQYERLPGGEWHDGLLMDLLADEL